MSTTRPPKQKAPAVACDCHFHISDLYDRYGAAPRVLVNNAAKLYGF